MTGGFDVPDDIFFRDLFSLGREEQAMVKGFVAGLKMNVGTGAEAGDDPPSVRKMTRPRHTGGA